MPEIGRPVSRDQSQLLQAQIRKSNRQQDVDQDVLDKVSGKARNDRANLFAKKDPTKLDKDDFLKMLSSQIQNQDPLNPADQKQFTQELTQFSQLEQMTNLNKKFEEWSTNKQIEKKLAASQFVGKVVVTDGNTISHGKEGQPPGAKIVFNLAKDAKEVIVRVNDQAGNLTAEIPLSDQGQGAHEVQWNGKSTDGYPAPPGDYRVSVKAWDKDFKSIVPETKTSGVVEGVSFEGEEVILTVDGKRVSLRDVNSFHENPKFAAKRVQSFQQGNLESAIPSSVESVKNNQPNDQQELTAKSLVNYD